MGLNQRLHFIGQEIRKRHGQGCAAIAQADAIHAHAVQMAQIDPADAEGAPCPQGIARRVGLVALVVVQLRLGLNPQKQLVSVPVPGQGGAHRAVFVVLGAKHQFAHGQVVDRQGVLGIEGHKHLTPVAPQDFLLHGVQLLKYAEEPAAPGIGQDGEHRRVLGNAQAVIGRCGKPLGQERIVANLLAFLAHKLARHLVAAEQPLHRVAEGRILLAFIFLQVGLGDDVHDEPPDFKGHNGFPGQIGIVALRDHHMQLVFAHLHRQPVMVQAFAGIADLRALGQRQGKHIGLAGVVRVRCALARAPQAAAGEVNQLAELEAVGAVLRQLGSFRGGSVNPQGHRLSRLHRQDGRAVFRGNAQGVGNKVIRHIRRHIAHIGLYSRAEGAHAPEGDCHRALGIRDLHIVNGQSGRCLGAAAHHHSGIDPLAIGGCNVAAVHVTHAPQVHRAVKVGGHVVALPVDHHRQGRVGNRVAAAVTDGQANRRIFRLRLNLHIAQERYALQAGLVPNQKPPGKHVQRQACTLAHIQRVAFLAYQPVVAIHVHLQASLRQG